MLKEKELDQECTGEKGGAEKKEQRICGEHKKPGLGDLLHQAVWLPIHTSLSPGKCLAQPVQPESHMVMCLRTMSLGSVRECVEVGGEGSGGKENAELELTGYGTQESK